MRIKQKLRNSLLIVLSTLFALFFGFIGENFLTAKAENTTNDTGIVQIFAPTGADGEFAASSFGKWTHTEAVEDYAKSPTGKVIHQTI